MATPHDEIQKQQAEAEALVEQGLPFSSAPSDQEIPLSHKRCSIAELDSDAQQRLEPYWSLRGRVDIHLLRDLVQEGYNHKNPLPSKTSSKSSSKNGSGRGSATKQANRQAKPALAAPRFSQKDVRSNTNFWDPVNASVNNVAICRPSHDAWGIHKIILLFCDDFCQRRYALPWWHARNDVREAVQPVLDVLGIASDDQVVRMLLASLPPGVTIPVHEDSGAWVAKTHRVHLPVLVEGGVDRILFRCGPTIDRMARIETQPGHVFEINNQAKHAVSNCSNDYRVHLILDYVDKDLAASMPPRINLEPGEILLQTRRSIDRWKDRGTRKTPSFMILGAQKGGTTSLYEYMVQHPLIVGAKRRETHCLDWRWNTNLNTVEEQRHWCHQFYHHEELFRHPSCLSGDSTPSYLIDSRRIIPRLKQVFDWPVKFFVMLRDPVRRAESHFAMVTSTDGTPAQLKTRGAEWREKSFRQVVMEDLERMRLCGLIPYWNIDNGTMDQELFDNFSGSDKEDNAWDLYMREIPLNTGSHCLLGRGLYELNLRPWFREFDESDFLVLQLESFKTEGVSSVMGKVWKHLGVPDHSVEDDSPKNTRDYEPLVDLQLRGYLERFFEPHNQRLSALLGEGWNGVWSVQHART